MKFVHQFIDDDPGFDGWGAVVMADFYGDGRPEFATGGKGGGIYFLFDYDPAAGQWHRSVMSDAYSPNKANVNQGRNHLDFLKQV